MIAVVLSSSALGCTADGPPELILRISSTLNIPHETNLLVARVQPMNGSNSERSYELGMPPRGSWPQTLPIVAGERSSRDLSIAIELRNSLPGMASVAVGYVEQAAEVPPAGEATINVVVPRACTDPDGDAYGIGFGCLGPDCNESRSDVPDPVPCPMTSRPDGGVSDQDGGGQGGPNCENGGAPCGSGDVCFMGQCIKHCTSSSDCGDLSFGCVPVIDLCLCKVPCFEPIDCGMNGCVDGCCRI
jgi:hypothetical protein